MYPFALLLGLPFDEAWVVAQQMAKKIVTNEFVVMGQIKDVVASYSPHRRADLLSNYPSFIKW